MALQARLRYAILDRDGFRCHYCKKSDVPLEVDHVIPKSLGGGDAPENLVAACRDCNIGKSSSPVGTFLRLPKPQLGVGSDELSKKNAEAAKWRNRLREEESKHRNTAEQLARLQRRAIELVVELHGGNCERIWILYRVGDLLDERGLPREKKIRDQVVPGTNDPELIVKALITASAKVACESDTPLDKACQELMAGFGFDQESISTAVEKLR